VIPVPLGLPAALLGQNLEPLLVPLRLQALAPAWPRVRLQRVARAVTADEPRASRSPLPWI